jgi:uncharacterized lipoprotein YmbA
MNRNDMNRTVRYLAMSFCLMLAACGTSPAVNYYALESVGDYVAKDDENSPILVLGPFRMPEYLNRSQFVTRGSGAEIVVDDVNRWAEPLDDAIHRVLATNVDVLSESLVVIAYPSAALAQPSYRLVGRIDHFIADSDGGVVMRVQWGIADHDGTVLLSTRRDRFESQAAKPADPGSIAQAMSDVLAQYSREIAAEFETIGLAD